MMSGRRILQGNNMRQIYYSFISSTHVLENGCIGVRLKELTKIICITSDEVEFN